LDGECLRQNINSGDQHGCRRRDHSHNCSANWSNGRNGRRTPRRIRSTLARRGYAGFNDGRGHGRRWWTEEGDSNDQNYNFPIIALKALTQYQPRDYQFAIQGRTLFDISQYPKGIKVLNGDISEDAARYQAKTLVDQLQSQKAHAQYHMIQQITSEEDVSDTELLHVPIWFVRYDHSGNKIVLVVDGNSGNVINSLGL